MTDTVRFPDMRREVIDALEHLANADYQRRVWCHREPTEASHLYSWDMVVHTLYDDALLAEGSRSAVGDVLLDGQEAELVDRVIAAIEAVFAEIGDADADPCTVIQAEGWPRVIEASRDAASVLALA